MTDLDYYNDWMTGKIIEWEEKCIRCGACCGVLDDPCGDLYKHLDGKFNCAVYEQRLGKRRTVSGKEFTCVPVREKIAQGHSWPGDERCGYKQA